MRRIIGAFALLLSLAFALGGFAFFSPYGLSGLTGFASQGTMLLCINDPPVINASACPLVVNQSTSLVDQQTSCFVSGVDADNDSLSWSVSLANSSTSSNETSWFSFDSASLELTLHPFQDQVGWQLLNISADDGANCSNSASSFLLNLSVLDLNDPPVLVSPVLDKEFLQGTTLMPYSLLDFFMDPDGDPLSFSVLGANIISVTIDPFSGLVSYSSSSCGTDYLLFRVTDPGGLSAESGVVQVTSRCVTSSSGSSGSSGGGGGGSSWSCMPSWACQDWSACLINGSRSKVCVDVHGCSDPYKRTFWENCTYHPTCFDGVQNQNETGVDCGGPCRPCGNCSDGIQNWGELGVDCGGPCPPCPTCFDGVQNQNETGVDCGGPCPACPVEEHPGVIQQKSPLTLWLMILAAFLFILVLLARFYQKSLLKFAARLGLMVAQKHHKKFFLTKEEASSLLKELSLLKRSVQEMSLPASSLVGQLALLARRFVRFVLDVPSELFSSDDLVSSWSRIPSPVFREALSSFFLFVEQEESSEKEHSYQEAELFLEELRAFVLLSAEVLPEYLTFDATEKEVLGSSLERAFALLFNGFLALEFEEVFSAKAHYLSLVRVYERLSAEQRKLLYARLLRLYNLIRYALSWVL